MQSGPLRSSLGWCRGLPFLSPYRVAVGAVCQIAPFRYAQRLIHRALLVEER